MTSPSGDRRAPRVGIVGTGMVGAMHARAALHAGAELVAIGASTEASATEAARRLGFRRGYGDWRQLVADEEIDVVHVCTPNYLHYELAAAVIDAGKHLVCEKPLTLESGEAERLDADARAAGLVAAVPFVYRFFPMVREARERVVRGDLGPVGLISGNYLQDWLASENSSNWRVDPALGGPSRAFADIGSHWCDLVEFVTAQPIVAVSAQLRTLRAQRPRPAAGSRTFSHASVDGPPDLEQVETEDVAVVSFRTAADAVGAVVVSQVSTGSKNRLSFELTGTTGTLAFEQQAPDSLVLGEERGHSTIERDPERLAPAAARYAILPAGHPQGFNDCFDAFVADVYEQLETGTPVEGMPDLAAGARAVRLTEAVLRSARDGARWVEIEPAAVAGSSIGQKTKSP